MKKRSLKFILLFVLISTFFLAQEWRICTRVVDGDTIILDGKERVRLIGVDTPETKHPKKPVQYFQRKDKYGRTLAYVFLEDGTFLNAEIIKQGYGFAYTRYPFKYLEEFRKYEREARENKRGLWAPREEKDQYKNITVYITRTGRKYHRAGCRYLRKSKIPISLKDAIKRGYTPCSVCNPPILKIDIPKIKRQEKAGFQ